MTSSFAYQGGRLDRAHTLRPDADLGALCRRPDTRFLAFWHGHHPVTPAPAIHLFAPGVVLPLIEAINLPCVLLGVEGDAALVAVDLSEMGEPGGVAPLVDGQNEWSWQTLRAVGAALPAPEAALLAYQRGMLLWRARTRFCSTCGQPLEVGEAGHVLRCSDPVCGMAHFPRTDPAVIVLVTDPQGRALLGRQPSWTPGLLSCLAGFVEPGESLEEAAVREVREEAGVEIGDLRYAASQPWPFPSSLMVGFFATAAAVEPTPDRREIETVAWISRAEAARFGDGIPGADGRRLPARDSIARMLIDTWLRGS